MKKILLLVVMTAACFAGDDDSGGGGGGGLGGSGSGSGSGGGSSGISGSRTLADLSLTEQTALCNEFADSFPVRTVSCTDGDQTIGVDSADCSMPETTTCTATVQNLRDCYAAMYDLSDSEYCNLTELPAACDPIAACN